MNESDQIFEEACRMVGQCCLMLAQNGEETDREELVYQMKRMYWKITEQPWQSNLALKLAIEQLEG